MMSSNLLLLWNKFRFRRLITVGEVAERLDDFQVFNYLPFLLNDTYYVKFTDLEDVNLDFEKRKFDTYIVQTDLLTTGQSYYVYYDSLEIV